MKRLPLVIQLIITVVVALFCGDHRPLIIANVNRIYVQNSIRKLTRTVLQNSGVSANEILFSVLCVVGEGGRGEVVRKCSLGF